MKQIIILAMIFLAPHKTMEPEAIRKFPPTYETDDTNYYNGEILLPDYVHSDTLIVIDAKALNWAMEYYDAASDGDIWDILNAYCEPYK